MLAKTSRRSPTLVLQFNPRRIGRSAFLVLIGVCILLPFYLTITKLPSYLATTNIESPPGDKPAPIVTRVTQTSTLIPERAQDGKTSLPTRPNNNVSTSMEPKASSSRTNNITSVESNASSLPVTVTMTSCNRLDLIHETLDTFFRFNLDINIQSFAIVVDCYQPVFVDTISRDYPDIRLMRSKSTATFGEKRVVDNIQLLFTHVLNEGTEFWVHLEDDWSFVRSGFVADGIKLLKHASTNENIWMVIGRDPNTQGSQRGRVTWRTYPDLGFSFGTLKPKAGWKNKWGSYTANPSVVNVKKAKALVGNFSSFPDEGTISETLGQKGALIAAFKDHRYYHIGEGKTTIFRRQK